SGHPELSGGRSFIETVRQKRYRMVLPFGSSFCCTAPSARGSAPVHWLALMLLLLATSKTRLGALAFTTVISLPETVLPLVFSRCRTELSPLASSLLLRTSALALSVRRNKVELE